MDMGEFALITLYIVTVALYFFMIGWAIGFEDNYEYNHRIEPTKTIVNLTTGDTTFVYIMK